MPTPPKTPEGFIATLEALGEGLFSAFRSRVELVSLELQEEKFRLIQTFVWISAAAFTAAMAVLFASLTLVYFYWETARLAALGGLAVFYASALVAILVLFRRFISRQPRPFAATLDELEKDRACIRTRN
jgi:uncharacterized membrane protein YqjE